MIINKNKMANGILSRLNKKTIRTKPGKIRKLFIKKNDIQWPVVRPKQWFFRTALSGSQYILPALQEVFE